MENIVLNTPSMAGQIYIGTDVLSRRLPALVKGQKNFVVTDSNVSELYAQRLKEWFSDAEIFVLPAGEENKTFASLGAILDKMTAAGLHRTSRLFAVGGGVVGDIGGLAAALYMRGISCVQIPTTLLAQVDSSVGGKTAVDLGGVKNVVGAFYQPMEVLADPNFLDTLPAREIKCGLGEIVKYAALSEEIFNAMENAKDLSDKNLLTGLISACIRHKAAVVTADEKETGERKSLNVGHTTGHAIELSYGLSHGESVLYGMAFETRMAMEKGICDPVYGERLLKIVERAIAVAPQRTVDFKDVGLCAEKARADKKNTDDGLIKTAVAKNKGEWTMMAQSFDEYKASLVRLAR